MLRWLLQRRSKPDPAVSEKCYLVVGLGNIGAEYAATRHNIGFMPVPSEVRQYSLEALKRLNVRPGLTCLWQVSGRSDIPFKEQVRLDKEYISSRSFMRDLVILFRTIPAILSGKGAY